MAFVPNPIFTAIDAQVAGTGPGIYGTQKPYIADPETGQLVANQNYGGEYSSAELSPHQETVEKTYVQYFGAGPESQQVIDYWASDMVSGKHYYEQKGYTPDQAEAMALGDMQLNFGASPEFQAIAQGGPNRANHVPFPGGSGSSSSGGGGSYTPAPAMIYGGSGSSGGTNINLTNKKAETAADTFKISKDDPNRLSMRNRNLFDTTYTTKVRPKVNTTTPGGAAKNTNIPTA